MIKEQTTSLYLTSSNGESFTNPFFLILTLLSPKIAYSEKSAQSNTCVTTKTDSSPKPVQGCNAFRAKYLVGPEEMWISPDPMREFASPYSYSPNPINTIDPDGLETVGFGDITVNGQEAQGSAWSQWFSSPMSVSVMGLERPNFDAINERLQGELYRIAPGAALNGVGASAAGTLTSGVRALNAGRISAAASEVGFVSVGGFKFSQYYYNRLLATGRTTPALIAREVLATGAKGVADSKAGFLRYEGGGWEMVLNPSTREVWHLQPLR